MPINVLVVDDNRTFRESFCELLASSFRQMQIAPAEDATSALRLLEQRPFDVLIVDYQLKAFSGTQLIRQLQQRASAAGKPAPVMVLMSGNPDIGVFARHLSVPFLHKPTDSQTCRSLLTPLLAQRGL